MKTLIGKLVFPAFLTLAGLVFVIFSFSNDQNWQFKLGAFSIVIVGVLFLLNSLDTVTKVAKLGLIVVLTILSAVLAGLDYKSIKDPVDFQNVKEKRYEYVIQQLKDIRTAQLAYKSVKGEYAPVFDSLLNFIYTDSIPVIKAVGDRPDTLTEEQAIEQGLISRDTAFVSARTSVFSEEYLKERAQGIPFNIDSLPFVPFSNGGKLIMNSGEVDKNNVMVKVFQVTCENKVLFPDWEKRFYDKLKDLQVGSMSDPNTNGNWE